MAGRLKLKSKGAGRRRVRGFDQGGLFDPEPIASGEYRGQELSKDSLGKGIMGGASLVAGAAGGAGGAGGIAAAFAKGGKVKKVLKKGVRRGR